MENTFMQQTRINPALRDFDQLPNSANVRLPVVKGLLNVSGATVWRLSKNQILNPIKLSERCTAWNVGELRAFLASKVGG
tara:strand:- start:150 stop:389 length:240 start_codon:yes stop_codon:yes gene_type:complete